MNGSWHRYRPGERWRRPPARARLVLEVDGAVAVCFDAPVVELFETRTEAPPPVAVAARARTSSRPTSMPPRRVAGCAIPPAPSSRSASRCSTSARWRASATSTRTRSSGSSASRRSRASSTLDDATLDRLVATARRLMRANVDARRGPERVTTAGDRGAPGVAVCLRPARPAVPPLRHADRGRPARATTCRARPTGARAARGRGREPDRRPLCPDADGLALRRHGRRRPTAQPPRGHGRQPGRHGPRRGHGRADVQRLVYETFAFLLEREAKESILRSFDITVVGRYFPEFEDEIQSRLAP